MRDNPRRGIKSEGKTRLGQNEENSCRIEPLEFYVLDLIGGTDMADKHRVDDMDFSEGVRVKDGQSVDKGRSIQHAKPENYLRPQTANVPPKPDNIGVKKST